ncbi:hypothetical protein [Actinomadura sp. GTD37]|uniref:hypothetical protein n=1 Tax=Actinomadura sp. GTD37 TaxID=1778030 RepID=UPI0035BF3F8B
MADPMTPERLRAERTRAVDAPGDDERLELCAVQIDRDQWRDRAHHLKAARDGALAALAQITAAAQRAARSDDPAPILYAALQAVERDDTQRRLENDLRELAVLRRDVGAVQAERDAALDEAGTAHNEAVRLRTELAELKRLGTSPTRDDLTGLETLCALLHSADETDPAAKDVAWRAFALIRAHREQRAEVEQWKATFGESSLRDAREVLAERDDYKNRLDQAMQDEAAITHEWDQARIAIECMGRILDGGVGHV